MHDKLVENIQKIKKEIETEAENSGRNASEISVMAASKYTDRAGVETLIQNGINIIGENRVQDAVKKLCAHDDGQIDIHEVFPDIEIHMIGYLQSNKINHALKLFDFIDSIDRISITEALEKRLGISGKILPILIDVHLTDEESKTGVKPNDLGSLVSYIQSNCPHLELRGLMGMGPWDPNPESARPFYKKLKTLFDVTRQQINAPEKFSILSMGMSADFHVAIPEGSTLLRIGRALFA